MEIQEGLSDVWHYKGAIFTAPARDGLLEYGFFKGDGEPGAGILPLSQTKKQKNTHRIQRPIVKKKDSVVQTHEPNTSSGQGCFVSPTNGGVENLAPTKEHTSACKPVKYFSFLGWIIKVNLLLTTKLSSFLTYSDRPECI